MNRLFAGVIALCLAAPLAASEIGDDGLHKADWMRDTFKDLQEDFEEANSEGKRLLLIVEQRGCLYCQDMHENTFSDPRVKSMLEDAYFPVQINLHGDTEVIDVDGESLTEKQATRRWGVLFTPTMVFLPTELDPSLPVSQQAVAMMPGAFSAGTTFDLLNWVAEERYLDQSEEDFQRYHARMIRERDDGDTR
ncbi:thioredoxin [Phaeobacter gallaeciensis]|uniref:Thioredoxin n=2 Tax=Roseobacteraceae TaxID=2854170 RepID=A0A366X4K4_9RHOB|nr:MULTISPECIES: thioredoxin family protein [Roseobacteraceae]MBT3139559.1 thioredoxin family protein [Falsiruegeria litorea]MBT8170022.1 thioredoxin family protein [Falsiruegeria litorea]RBW58581.1 thioredoxin [Phaeobacter gallaeciensis]